MISSKASIHKNAKVGKNVIIGDFCVIGADVEIGDECHLVNSVNIQGSTKIGKKNTFFPYCSIGTLPQDLKFKGEKSYLEIGDNNSFREYSNISIGTEHGGLITKIKNNNLFMVGSHIGHDCKLGNNLVIANNAAIAGHCIFDDNVIIGGNSAVLQFTKIGKGAMVGGMTGVLKDVIPFALSIGNRNYLQGLNLIGLRRKKYDNKKIMGLDKAYKEIFSSKNLHENLSKINGEYKDNELVSEVIRFIEKDKKRPICVPQN